MLENFGCDLGCKLLCKLSLELVRLVGKSLGVSMPTVVSATTDGSKLTRTKVQIPYIEPVQVKVSPFLRLPPVLALPLKRVVLCGVYRLRYGLKKDGAPSEVYGSLTEEI